MRIAKPKIMWAVVWASGVIVSFTIRNTRKESIATFCDNGPEEDPDEWYLWESKGLRTVKVRVEQVKK